MNYKYIVGIDEVGRGPLAGPVYVCAFRVFVDDIEGLVQGTDLPLRDSKKLTEKMREKWFSFLEQKRKDGLVKYTVSAASSSQIDTRGISVCISGCLDDALGRIVSKEERKDTLVLLDGGLKARPEYAQQTIIKGDEKEAVIAFASIVAKVLRDRSMVELHTKFPHYGFNDHKGYGTKKHIQAIRDFGTIGEHRTSFLKNL
jgi:ribonuclease HII